MNFHEFVEGPILGLWERLGTSFVFCQCPWEKLRRSSVRAVSWQIKSASSSCRAYCQAREHKCEQPQEICTASVWQSQLRFFCRKIQLRKNTSLQGSATRVLVPSMMDLVIVCCGCYFWPCQWRGEQRHLVSLFCACHFPLSSCARSRSLRHTFAAFVPN